MSAFTIFKHCVEAIRENALVERETSTDKEFHFQNWFKRRLAETKLNFDPGPRNGYPDFTLVSPAEGYELKGLAYPGRYVDFDYNSQVPTGVHNGRIIYYVFGRYPIEPDGNTYPLLDLVICHGDFLNTNHEYKHKNRSVTGFGSYGDLAIRDRKMYRGPTPFQLVEGVAHQQTLILPAEVPPEAGFVEVAQLKRTEASEIIIGYTFNLQTNEIVAKKALNPSAGREHTFRAWRLEGSPATSVFIRALDPTNLELEIEDDNDE